MFVSLSGRIFSTNKLAKLLRDLVVFGAVKGRSIVDLLFAARLQSFVRSSQKDFRLSSAARGKQISFQLLLWRRCEENVGCQFPSLEEWFAKANRGKHYMLKMLFAFGQDKVSLLFKNP